MANFAVSIIEIDRYTYDGVLLLNEHDDRYFLFHKFGVHIIPFTTKRINYRKEKMI